MKVELGFTIDKNLLKQLEILNSNLSELSKKEGVNTAELSETLESFSETIKTFLDTAQIITTKGE